MLPRIAIKFTPEFGVHDVNDGAFSAPRAADMFTTRSARAILALPAAGSQYCLLSRDADRQAGRADSYREPTAAERMSALVDTSVLIDYLRGHQGAAGLLEAERAASPLHASEITRLEVLAACNVRDFPMFGDLRSPY
jgi:hypothetical protein